MFSRRGLLDHRKTERVSRSEKMCARIALSLTLPESSRDESPDWAPPNNSQPPNGKAFQIRRGSFAMHASIKQPPSLFQNTKILSILSSSTPLFQMPPSPPPTHTHTPARPFILPPQSPVSPRKIPRLLNSWPPLFPAPPLKRSRSRVPR